MEAALQRESIPNRVLSGVKFFERTEIKDLLAYLQLVDNPDYEPSFLRVINVPKRQIGEKVCPNVFVELLNNSLTKLEHKRNHQHRAEKEDLSHGLGREDRSGPYSRYPAICETESPKFRQSHQLSESVCQ